MFTGIIEKVGKIVKRGFNPDHSGSLLIRSAVWNDSLIRGESIAINGACLSLESFKMHDSEVEMSFNALKETFDRTNLKDLPIGSEVNMERALKAGGRLGGHFVTGHIDSVCRVSSFEKFGRDWKLIVACDKDLSRFIVFKGSVAIDGVSLTVAETEKDFFSVYLIPITMEHSSLKRLKAGDFVNVETDILGKYVLNAVGSLKEKKKLDFDFLRNAGYE